MKIAQDFTLKKIADSFAVVPTGKNVVDFTAMITINETGAFIWNILQEDCDIETISKKMCDEYDIDMQTATDDAIEFLKILEDNNVLVK